MDLTWGIVLAQIRSLLTVKLSETNWSDEQANANVLVYNDSFKEPYYRDAWRTNEEYAIFRAEQANGRGNAPDIRKASRFVRAGPLAPR